MNSSNPLIRSHLASFGISLVINTVLVVLLLTLIQFQVNPENDEFAVQVHEVVSPEEIIEPEEIIDEPEMDPLETSDAISNSTDEMVSEMIEDSLDQQPEPVVDAVSSPVLLQGLNQLSTLDTGELPGAGLGQTTRFMGQSAKGSRFGFVIDYSKSMSKTQLRVMKHELYTAVQTVGEKGLVSLLFFSGPVWRPDQDANEATKKWKSTKGSNRNWAVKEGEEMVNPRWLIPNRKNLAALLRMIHQTPTTYGTDWYPPMKLALEMQPRPDIIFFMTDGQCGQQSVNKTIELVKSIPEGSVQINTVALGIAEEKVPGLKTIAELTGGKFKHYSSPKLKEIADNLPDAPTKFKDFDLTYLEDSEVLSIMNAPKGSTAQALPVQEEPEVEFRIY